RRRTARPQALRWSACAPALHMPRPAATHAPVPRCSRGGERHRDAGMDGHALMRKIRALGVRHGNVPAIALTAFASPADRTQALLAGYQVFLPKPFDPTQLVTLVARLAGVLPSD